MKRTILTLVLATVASGSMAMPALAQDGAQEKTTMSPATSTMPQVGTQAPDFSLPDANGKPVSLKDFAGSKAIVLYFYPKADTPGCTKEACGFRDALGEYKKRNITVLGVSPDPVQDIRKFADKYGLPFPLLSDADHSVSERYGVWKEKENAGKKYWGIARTTFIIQDGKIVRVMENVKPDGHDQETLAWLKEDMK
jgi:thioredoxin-dependent peroxiredoxin